MLDSVDLGEDLVQVPRRTNVWTLLSKLRGIQGAKLSPPSPDCLIRHPARPSFLQCCDRSGKSGSTVKRSALPLQSEDEDDTSQGGSPPQLLTPLS